MKYIKGDYKFNSFPSGKACFCKGTHSFTKNNTPFQGEDAG